MNIDKLIYNKPLTLREICELIEEEFPRGKAQQLFLKKLREVVIVEEIGKGRGKKYILKEKDKDNTFCSPQSPNNDILNINNNIYEEFVGKKVNEKHEFWHTPNYDNYNILFSNLPIGSQYNTIKELCVSTCIYYNNEHPNRSLELIQQMYRIEKENNKYIVKEKYLVPIERVDFRVDKQTAWTMGNVLLSLMYSNSREGSIYTFFSYGQLYRYAQMHNENYEKYRYNRDTLALETDMEIRVINDFYNVTNGVFKSNVKKGLKNLDNRCLAFSTEGIAICEILDGKEIHRLANDYEISVILEHEKKALRYFGFSSKKMVWENHMFMEFYDKVCEGIRGEGKIYANCSFENMKYYYKCIKLIHCYENTKIDYYEELEKKIIKEAKKQSTKKITESKRYIEETMTPLKEKLID